MPKSEVRALARDFALPVADKSDSQDICFVPQGRYTSIVERLKPGAAEAGRHRACRRARARPPRRASSTTRSASAADWASRAPRRCMWSASMPTASASSSVRARACTRTGSACATSTGWATRRFPTQGLMSPRASAPARRRSRRRYLRQGGKAKVLLARRRIWYCCRARPASSMPMHRPRARVLGGGWIERALSRSEQAEHGRRRDWTLPRAEPVRMRQG